MLSINLNKSSFRKNTLAMILAVFCTIAGHTRLSFSEEQQPVKNSPKPKVISSDTNHDGKPDQWQYYDNGGDITRSEADTNLDGKVDEVGYFVNGKLAKVEKDSDYDGKMDKWVEY